MVNYTKMPDIRKRNIVSISVYFFISIIFANFLHINSIGVQSIVRNSIAALISALAIPLMVEGSRMKGEVANSVTNDFIVLRHRVFVTGICFIIYTLVPLEYSLPVFFPFLLTGVCSINICFTLVSLFFMNGMLINQASNVQVAAQFMLLVFSIVLSDAFHKWKGQSIFILFLANFITKIYENFSIYVIPDYHRLLIFIIISLGFSILCLILGKLYEVNVITQSHDAKPEIKQTVNNENNIANYQEKNNALESEISVDYQYYISEDYPLVQDILKYDISEYNHARNLQRAAKLAARSIKADEELIEMAAFYYRLGILQGQPIIDNSLKMAYDYCFPKSVINILEEYDGIKRIPQSRESAIIHMANACLIKAELLRSKKLSSNWNQDMVIYQTLNELSSTGIYDESGISMNQFLVIRDTLVKEGLNV